MSEAEEVELKTLCDALGDAELSDGQRARLNALLAGSEEARRCYIRHAALASSLVSYASELQTEPRKRTARVVQFPVAWRWAAGALAAAAAVVLAVVFARQETPASDHDSVAWVTGAQDAEWSDATISTGDALERGKHLDLRKGVAELTFDSGARVTVEAPASLDVQSAWAAGLRSGSVTSIAAPDAAGFRVNNRAVNVTNLGGEVRVIAESNGVAEVCALEGAAEATRPGRGETLVLRDRQARRFARDGVTRVAGARFARRASRLDRRGRPLKFARWSFDGESAFTAQTVGFNASGFTATPSNADATSADAWVRPGRWQRSLALDGRRFLAAPLPGAMPRTVAFWVKVPGDAPLGKGVAMVGLRGRPRSLVRDAQITWNREPEQGPLGALRTEQEGSVIVGRTSLRDGAWHHVAVLFLGGKRARGFVQVKQYVDGRLDGAGLVPWRSEGVRGKGGASLAIGRAAGDAHEGAKGFDGELDELLIADRPLTPDEIRTLMEQNRVPGGT